VRAVDVIARKRDGYPLHEAEISWFVRNYVDGVVTDYQAAAWLMAVYLRGMDRDETATLTRAMAVSGRTLDLGPLAARAVDKHSSGGVGDKTTLVVGPIAAAAGVVVPKMSGRGLGITGGTLDKLESIPGLRVDLSESEIVRQAAEAGLVIAGQTSDLAPADGRLYALRDVTATVDSLPLIVSSIMSKKLAGGAPSIVLDVKAGSGAFMPSLDRAVALAEGLVDVGTTCARRVVAHVTSMEQPLGYAVGHAVEVREAIDVLANRGPADVRELALTLASEMILAAGLASNASAARSLADGALRSGAALTTFARMVEAQGGNPRVVEEPGVLPAAPVVITVPAGSTGWVSRLDAGTVGRAVVGLGAGRQRKGEPIDNRVGVVFHRKVGDPVSPDTPLFDIHLASKEQADAATQAIRAAYAFAESPPPPAPLFLRRITSGGDNSS
jgi:pyrimidine-nucleoside phosphorylase